MTVRTILYRVLIGWWFDLPLTDVEHKRKAWSK